MALGIFVLRRNINAPDTDIQHLTHLFLGIEFIEPGDRGIHIHIQSEKGTVVLHLRNNQIIHFPDTFCLRCDHALHIDSLSVMGAVSANPDMKRIISQRSLRLGILLQKRRISLRLHQLCNKKKLIVGNHHLHPYTGIDLYILLFLFHLPGDLRLPFFPQNTKQSHFRPPVPVTILSLSKYPLFLV